MYLSTEYRIPHVLKLHKNVQASIIWFVLPMSYRILFNSTLNIKFGSTFALMCAYPRPAPSLYNYEIAFAIWNQSILLHLT